jgi:hypothetical protein
METTFKETSEVVITEVSIGEHKIVPFMISLEVKKGSDLWELIMYNSRFQEILDKQLLRIPKENCSDYYYNREMERVDKLEKDINGCETKITIKIELEKWS